MSKVIQIQTLVVNVLGHETSRIKRIVEPLQRRGNNYRH